MTMIDLGKLVYLWRGDYSAEATYAKYDTCRYQGKVYICTADTVAEEDPVSTPAKWDVMTESASGMTTAGDLLYHDGTNVVRLAAGSTENVLTIGADGLPVWSKDSTRVINVAHYNWSTIHRVAWSALGNIFNGSQWTYTPKKAGSKFFVQLSAAIRNSAHYGPVYWVHQRRLADNSLPDGWQYWTDWENYNPSDIPNPTAFNPGTRDFTMADDVYNANASSIERVQASGLISPGLASDERLELGLTGYCFASNTLQCNENRLQTSTNAIRYSYSYFTVWELDPASNE